MGKGSRRPGRYLESEAAQVVNLAAGLSTYPYRAGWMDKVLYYAEVDLPGMAEYKKEMMRSLRISGAVSEPVVPVNHVSMDITHSALMDHLDSSGWDRSGRRGNMDWSELCSCSSGQICGFCKVLTVIVIAVLCGVVGYLIGRKK